MRQRGRLTSHLTCPQRRATILPRLKSRSNPLNSHLNLCSPVHRGLLSIVPFIGSHRSMNCKRDALRLYKRQVS
jgi:hypothetical protein